jgi:hypothetical protein
MESKFFTLTSLLFLLGGCGQQQLTLPVTHAAVSPSADLNPPELELPPPARVEPGPLQAATDTIYETTPSKTCYSYMLERPKDQQAVAVQARLRKADQMSEAFGSHLVSVDLLGDHVNVLSLQLPAVRTASSTFLRQVSSVVEDYLTEPSIQDYLCDAGFAEVRLSERSSNDGRMHPLWTARITTDGLVTVAR